MTTADQIIPSSPRRSLAKAVSWRVVGSLDTMLLSFLILTFAGSVFGLEEASHGENLQTSSLIALTEVLTKLALYYGHERMWDRIRWGNATARTGIVREGRRRSVVKTATWRVIATLDTMLLAYLFTGSLATAVSIGSLEVITKLFLYYGHERVWARIGWN